MDEGMGRLVIRKLKVAFLAAFIFSIAWSLWGILTNSEWSSQLGTEFIGTLLFYFYYIAFILLIYGSLVSIAIEALQRKWFQQANWLYVLLLGMCGAANGLLFPYKKFVILGILAAVLYALIDKWLLKRGTEKKSSKLIFILPTAACLILWVYFTFTSSLLPPFTEEEAVSNATNTDSSMAIDRFPKEVGTWKGAIDGYQVERTTAVEKSGEDLYIVVFTEIWNKGSARDSWVISYEVDRGSSVLYDEKGKLPPYEK